MKIIFVKAFVIFPSAALKGREPVVRRTFAVLALALAPEIVIVIGVVNALFALLEPIVLIRGVVDHQIHKNLKSSLVSLVKNLFKQIKVAVVRRDVFIVGNVVSVVCVRRRIYGREPDTVNSETLYIVELIKNAVEISYAVAVSVLERTAPYLVKGVFLVPSVIQF